jgi:hypothetical protein
MNRLPTKVSKTVEKRRERDGSLEIGAEYIEGELGTGSAGTEYADDGELEAGSAGTE